MRIVDPIDEYVGKNDDILCLGERSENDPF